MPKRTLQNTSIKKRNRKIGFRARMKTLCGRMVMKRRRRKGRKELSA